MTQHDTETTLLPAEIILFRVCLCIHMKKVEILSAFKDANMDTQFPPFLIHYCLPHTGALRMKWRISIINFDTYFIFHGTFLILGQCFN